MPTAPKIAVEAPTYGPDVAHVASVDDAHDRVAPVRSGTAVLVKASRAAGLEQLAGKLAAPDGGAADRRG